MFRLDFFDFLQNLCRVVPYKANLVEVAHEQFGPFFVLTKQNDLGNSLLSLQVLIVLVWKGGGADDYDYAVGVDRMKLAFQGTQRAEFFYGELFLEEFKIFAVFVIVDSGVYPEKDHV